MLVHRTKKLLVWSTSVGLDIFLLANKVDPDQAADMGLLCLQKC